MKFENTAVWGFEGSFRGIRNPLASWQKSDSSVIFHAVENFEPDDPMGAKYYEWNEKFGVNFKMGEKDKDLAQRLIKAGSPDRKFMRQIFVSVDITAPLYWWKEADTYKVGTVANSTSTMHKLASTPITIDCFETGDYNPDLVFEEGTPFDRELTIDDVIGTDEDNFYTCETFIGFLEKLRLKYLETKDKRYWKELVRWLPNSWLQTRTVTMNYENIYSMIRQRRFHKLNEWSGKDDPSKPNFISWARTLPYADELLFYGLDENN